jgi:glycosyltransferase involved in cell wall biosynthesis
MKVLLVYPQTPDTFWSFNYAMPQTRLCHRLLKEGRLEAESTGNNTDAVLNFRPKLDREFLINGYRDLMRELYAPRNYYQRIRTFLEHHTPSGSRLRISWIELKAFVKSLWLLGVIDSERLTYWRFLVTTLLRRPSQFCGAMELTILGYHFRRVARSL